MNSPNIPLRDNSIDGRIRPIDVPGFIAAQLLGGTIATALACWLWPMLPAHSHSVMVPHDFEERYGK